MIPNNINKDIDSDIDTSNNTSDNANNSNKISNNTSDNNSNNASDNTSNSDSTLIPHMPSWISCTAALSAGLFAGGLHGAMLVGWDRISYRVQTLRQLALFDTLRLNMNKTLSKVKARYKWISTPLSKLNPISLHRIPPVPTAALWGTCVMHSLVHGALFGTYVMTKQVLLDRTESLILRPYHDYYRLNHTQYQNQEDAGWNSTNSSGNNNSNNNSSSSASKHLQRFDNTMGIAMVTIAGGVAGAMSEYITIICDSIALDSRTFKFKSKFKFAAASTSQKLTFLNFKVPIRQIFGFSIVLPSALGFLAYEYGKSLMESHDDDKHRSKSSNHIHTLKHL